MTNGKTVLVVRSGGGMPGLDIHAGIWLAMERAGIVATCCVGTSAGAIISAMDASQWDAVAAARYLASLRDSDVRQERAFWKLRIPWIDHFMLTDKIRAQLDLMCRRHFAELSKPVALYATRADNAQAVNVSALAPDVPTACLASMAICGVFPKVRLNGEDYVDGGVRCNLPLPPDWRDYDEVWLCVATGIRGAYRRKSGILTNLMQNLHWLMEDQVQDVLDIVADAPNVRVLRPPIANPDGALHFHHEAIESARIWTEMELKALGFPPLETA